MTVRTTHCNRTAVVATAAAEPPRMAIPVAVASVPAGFPSPAEQHSDGELDLNDLLVRKPAATFFVRVSGDSMTGAGIFDGDLLIVDRSLEAKDGDVVVAVLEGDFTVKRLKKSAGGWRLAPENPDYGDVPLTDGAEVWGVVTASVRRHGA